MNITNKEMAKLLRDVADKIEPISDKSKAGRKKVVAQMDRIPLTIEAHRRTIEAFRSGFLGIRRPENPPNSETKPKRDKGGH
ncbi:MAG: hypothetical protein ABSF60_05535 [Verrucomicrobiota bacterium]